jgi:predicted RNA-binding Zn ribbon-like protein
MIGDKGVRMTDPSSAQEWGTEAGKLCLDFANTVDWHRSDRPSDRLTGYAHLVSWAQAQGLLGESESRRLLDRAARHPRQGEAVLRRARALREAIYHIFTAPGLGRRVDPQNLQVLNANLSEAMSRARLEDQGEHFGWGWQTEDDDLDRILWPVARSAADLLVSEDRQRVGQCADDRGCGWLFFDASRNHSRRWCSMDGCGNRAKAKRHYARERGQTSAG